MREAGVRKDNEREQTLILQCARVQIPAADHPRIRELAARTLDWDYLIETAEWHGVASLVLKNLRSAGADAPRGAFDRLDEGLVQTTAANLANTRQLADVLGLLRAHRIPVVVWKGPAFAVSIYGHLGLRSSSDIDLIVPRDVIRDVRELMLAGGYTLSDRTRHLFDSVVPSTAREYEFIPNTRGLAAVEAQVAVAPWPLAVRLDARALIDRAVTVNVAGIPVPALCAEDLLLALAVHGTSHLWGALRLLSDIDAAIGAGVAWETVVERARAARMRRFLTIGLALAHRLLNTTLPDDVLARIGRDRVAAHVTDQYAARLFAPVRPFFRHLWRDWVYVNSREHVSDRFRYGLRQLAFEHAIRHWDRLTVKRAARLRQALRR